MIDPQVRYAWWHLDTEGIWRECSMCCPVCVSGNIAGVVTIRGYGAKPAPYYDWVIHATRQEAFQDVYKVAFRDALACGLDYEKATQSARRVLQHLTVDYSEATRREGKRLIEKWSREEKQQ